MSRPITSFYRLQFGQDMTFAKAAALVPYLDDLGISHLYASPIFEARPGSTHGYDVTDPNRFSSVLGGAEGFDRLSAALHGVDMGLMLDIVPNHMAASEHNVYLKDVLKNGTGSPHACFFDIDWGAEERLTLPILGKPLKEVLEIGELSVVEEDGQSFLAYYDRRFPLREGTSTLPLPDLVEAQHYRLTFWRELDTLNYRRFFDITDLIGMRQEDERVFEGTHRLVRQLLADGRVDALRVDHIDGLRDPGEYLRNLAGLFPHPEDPPIYVEKILEGDETLPPEWPVRGETGYWTLGRMDRLFMPPSSEAVFADHAPSAYGREAFERTVEKAKTEILETSFAHEFGSLAKRLSVPKGRLQELAKSFSVYRTYLSPHALPAENDRERRKLRHFAEAAGTQTLTGQLGDPARDVAMRFQQMTGPIMAKSLEDTTFYRYIGNFALNEVGSDPAEFSLSAEDLHTETKARMARHPQAMNTLSTHDTKRSEDARARLIAAAWNADSVVPKLASIASSLGAPSERSGYHLAQAALAIWDPAKHGAMTERLAAYIVKAEREAKLDTSWIDPSSAYEGELKASAERLVQEQGPAFDDLVGELDEAEAAIVLGRAVLKLTLAGIPDTYQGTERIARRLVDPDNRSAPDWNGELQTQLDRRKFGVTRKLLRLRRENPRLFTEGAYEPIAAPPHCFGFRRRHDDQSLEVTIALRSGTALPRLNGRQVIDEPFARVSLLSG